MKVLIEFKHIEQNPFTNCLKWVTKKRIITIEDLDELNVLGDRLVDVKVLEKD